MLSDRKYKRALLVGLALDLLIVAVIATFFADDANKWLLWVAGLILAKWGLELVLGLISLIRRGLWFAFFGGRASMVRHWKDYFALNGLPKSRLYGEDGEEYLTRICSDESLTAEVRIAAATRIAILNTARAQSKFMDTLLETYALDRAVEDYAEIEAAVQ